MIPEDNNWEDWKAFEGAYEEGLDKIRKLIYQTLSRDVTKIYGERRLNPKLQQMRERTNSEFEQRQEARIRISKLKEALEEIGQGDGRDEAAEVRRRQERWTKKINPILESIPEEERMKRFGSTELREIWKEMETSEDHRQ
jgi:hypothetical protein